MNVWSARTGGGIDAAFQAFSSSIAEDAAFLPHDIMGSIAHVRGLARVGLLEAEQAGQLSSGLHQLLREAEEGAFQLDPALEDVHMNIEAALTQRLGDLGRRLHTGRSRNDQVATCITLYAREQLHALADAALNLAQALAQQAQIHAQTPWVARTHGQPAQPATLGFLLMAHAFRFQDASRHALATFEAIGESPLGSGAVAGSTLPLDPRYTADLLGLRPPRNALLCTGGRDAALAALDATTRVATAASSLAEDLFGFTTRQAFRLPAGLSTGSSLMPQKRNPDALELVRGHARSLPSHEAAVQAVCLPLGLGYVRDLQVVKPHLLQALAQARGVLDILAACLAGGRFDAEALRKDLELPGIGATDAAEALVAAGIPFRTAYSAVAAACAQEDPVQALRQGGLPNAAIEAAVDALEPDATRRTTLGGPAPAALAQALQQFTDHQVRLRAHWDEATEDVAVPRRLLETQVVA